MKIITHVVPLLGGGLGPICAACVETAPEGTDLDRLRVPTTGHCEICCECEPGTQDSDPCGPSCSVCGDTDSKIVDNLCLPCLIWARFVLGREVA